MKRRTFFSWAVFARAFVVLLAAGVMAAVVGKGLRLFLEFMYMNTSSGAWSAKGPENFWYQAFYFVSHKQDYLVAGGCVLALALCLGWIIQPAFDRLGGLIRRGIALDGPAEPVKLPRAMATLEADMGRINEDLARWQLAAREAEQRKNELVAYMAHDIRTPLTSVLGYLTLLCQAPPLPEDTRQAYSAVALRQAERMSVLVEELFDITRYNIHHLELQKTTVDLRMLLQQLAEELLPTAADKGLTVTLAQGEPLPVFADGDKLSRALENLLTNAVAYTPQGGQITIDLTEEPQGLAQVAIANNGVEIPPEKLARLFDRFYRGDTARASGGGSGLGLAIARDIIEAHGGTLTATNAHRVTTFRVTLESL